MSPYLRAHAGNPVDWWPWGEAAFAEAEARQVPVFVSIGYATCHWCHVMARESFSDPELAGYLNDHFVAIKVDREEHPDVDASYLAAAGAFTQNLGWPLSVFATPSGAAFFAGTYYPPVPSGQLPSFREVLEAIVDAWRNEREQVSEVGSSLVAALAGIAHRPAPEQLDLATALAGLQRLEDPEFGGLGRGSKFPNAPVLRFLLEAGDRAFAARTLGAMARSELRDPVDGGFFRYAVQRDWTEPHYERMLSDNAQLLDVATRLGDAEVAEGIARFLLGTLRLPSGAFASAQDSESMLDGVRSEGGWYRLDAAGRAAQPPPSLDAKVLTGINGLAIGALATAGLRFARADWIDAARSAADAVLAAHRSPGILARASLDGRRSDAPATLEDYGGLAGGLLRLALASGDPGYAVAARELVEACAGGVPGGADPVLASRGLALAGEASDGAVPSGPALLADAAVLLWGMTGERVHRDIAEHAVAPSLAEAAERPSAYGAALEIAARLRRSQRQLVVVGGGDVPLEEVARGVDADVLTILTEVSAAAFAAAGFELFEARTRRDGRETAYWCRQFVCALPVTDAAALSTALTASP